MTDHIKKDGPMLKIVESRIDQFKTLLSQMDNEEMKQALPIFKRAMKRASSDTASNFRIGDKVKFDAKTRGIIRGIVVKRNQRTAKVQTEGGTTWTVGWGALESDA